MARTFWVESGELWTADGAHVTWHGQPDGKPVHSVVSLAGTEEAVVLLEFEAGPRSAAGVIRGWPNLVRVRADGSVVWRANALDDQDSWVGVHCSAGVLTATTWSGYLVTLNSDTGANTSKVFTK